MGDDEVTEGAIDALLDQADCMDENGEFPAEDELAGCGAELARRRSGLTEPFVVHVLPSTGGLDPPGQVFEECLKPVDPKSRVEAPGGRTFPMSRQVPQARPASQRRSGRYARVHGSCSGRIGEVCG